MASTTGLDLSISGLASGVDWKTVVSQLAQAERAPAILWESQQKTIDLKNAAFTNIKNYLATLQTDIQSLKDPTLFDRRAAASSDSALATATANSTAVLGNYTFNVIRLATAARINGASNMGRAISADGDLSAVTLATAGFATSITAGTFTVNGEQVTIATSDSLQQVFDKIATATNNLVTASYDTQSDTITLTSSDDSEIVLGSASDSSNFLQATRLYNNGTGSITSTSALGSVRVTALMAESGLSTAIVDDGTGQGEFTVNGVSITFNASTDSIQDVLNRINSSSAGVSATYDAFSDRFVLANKAGGDIGIAVEDVAGNFLAATGLAGGALVHGQNLAYTVNGGPEMVSQSNTITEVSSGVAGLSVTALAEGTVTVTVTNDTSKLKSTIQSFVTNYNKVQSYITGQSATTTNSDGKITAGLLTGDLDASRIASTLRSISFSPVSLPGLTSALDQLADFGLNTSGKNSSITLDETRLDAALTNLNQTKVFFSDATSGLAARLDAYLTNTIGDTGTLTNHQTQLTKQSTAIDAQIANLEKIIAADSAKWTKAFQKMEQVQSQLNQQLTYLAQQLNTWNS